jgi:hypothetical protein
MSQQGDMHVWSGPILITPASSVHTIPVIFGENMNIANGGPFTSVAPKQDNLNVIKLTKDNLVSVARGLVRKNGPSVSAKADYIAYGAEHTGENFRLGDFLVQDYDYTHDREFLRLATLDERKKYDLR